MKYGTEKKKELIKRKKYKAAEIVLHKALDKTPKDAYILTQLANVLWNRCKDEEALRYANKAKEVCPVMPLLNYTRGRILWSLEKGLDYIAFSEHGEGVRWAKKLLRNMQKQIKIILEG